MNDTKINVFETTMAPKMTNFDESSIEYVNYNPTKIQESGKKENHKKMVA